MGIALLGRGDAQNLRLLHQRTNPVNLLTALYGAVRQHVGLIEYPRKGLYAIVFIATDTSGEICDMLPDDARPVSVFLPTTPNPTSGFLLFIPRKEIKILDMSVEEGAKLVISAGLVTPVHKDKLKELADAAKNGNGAKNGNEGRAKTPVTPEKPKTAA